MKEGDLIAKIRLVPDMVRLNEAQSRVEKAKIALDAAEKDHARNVALSRDGTISASAFQTYQTALENTRTELRTASDNLDLIQKGISRTTGEASNTLVRSTIAGTVLEVPVKVGNSVIETNTFNEGTTIATIADMGDMIFLGKVDESEVGKLKPGMTLLLTIGAVDGTKPEATLEHIAPKGVEKEGAIQFEIKAALKPIKDVVIRANYSANADIVLDRRDDVRSGIGRAQLLGVRQRLIHQIGKEVAGIAKSALWLSQGGILGVGRGFFHIGGYDTCHFEPLFGS